MFAQERRRAPQHRRRCAEPVRDGGIQGFTQHRMIQALNELAMNVRGRAGQIRRFVRRDERYAEALCLCGDLVPLLGTHPFGEMCTKFAYGALGYLELEPVIVE